MRKFSSFFSEHSPVIIVLGIIFVLFSAILIPLISSSRFWEGSDGCDATSSPQVPVLISVEQNPVTLVVTATFRDESDNEQWFALERRQGTRFTFPVLAVGTSPDATDFESLPLSKEVGRLVTIEDRGIVGAETRNLVPGTEYVYTVRALNCHFPSESSNDIKIVAMGPS